MTTANWGAHNRHAGAALHQKQRRNRAARRHWTAQLRAWAGSAWRRGTR